jgi:hypothetical protein
LLIETPVPTSFEELLWLGIGLTFSRAFAEFDFKAQETEWFKNLSLFRKWLVKAFFDAFHHWWMGGILIAYNVEVSAWLAGFYITPLIVYWVGWGVLLDDIPDLPSRLKKYFKYFFVNRESDHE